MEVALRDGGWSFAPCTWRELNKLACLMPQGSSAIVQFLPILLGFPIVVVQARLGLQAVPRRLAFLRVD